MLLYQPSPSEILASVARAKHSHPALAKRLDKTTAILADINGNFDGDCDGWRVRSQTESVNWHAVGSAGCSCDDYRINAPRADRHYFCKHLLAYYGYRRMLGNALNRRLIGNIQYMHDRQRARVAPGSILAVTEKRLRAVAYWADYRFPRHLCFLRLDATDRLVPQGDDDYQALAEWLATAPAFEQEQDAPRMEDYTPDRLPEWSQGDFRHWMHTGELPALRESF